MPEDPYWLLLLDLNSEDKSPSVSGLTCSKKYCVKKIVENSSEAATWGQASGGERRASSVDQGVTVTLKAAEWLVPEVAVTVMLEVPGGVPFDGGGALLPPPQLTRQKPSVSAPNAKDHLLIFLPRLPIPKTNTPNAIATNHAAKVQGAKVQGFGTPVGTAAALCAVVVMVSVVDTGLPPGVWPAGEKLQLEAAGNPLQANVMEEFRPLTGLTVMVNVAV